MQLGMSILESNDYKRWEEEHMGSFFKMIYQQKIKFIYVDKKGVNNMLDNFNIVKNLYRDKHKVLQSREEIYLNTWKAYSPIWSTEDMAESILEFHIFDKYEITDNPLDFIPFSELAEYIREKISPVSDTYIGRLLNYMNLKSNDKKVNKKTIRGRLGIRKISTLMETNQYREVEV